MKPWLKRILLAALVALFLYGGYIGFQFFHAFRMFGTEDQIHYTYFPLAMALEDYASTNNAAAPSLEVLIPEFIESIPQTDLINKMDYHPHHDGQNWDLSLYSDVHGENRVYTWRSNGEYTEDEEERVILKYHGRWVVLEGDRVGTEE